MNKIAIFASGSGTNAENIINHFERGKVAKVVLVLSENEQAFVFERALKLNVPALHFTLEELKNGKVLSVLKHYQIDYIILAGFLKLFPASIIEEFPHKIVNIHPALLPKFGGKGMYGSKVHQAVIESGENESGITVHYVNQNYDDGNILFQAKCPVLKSDSPETLAQRVHALEYKYFPQVIEQMIIDSQSNETL
jgi:phosphoribosylglycinamide formyltransferase-1